MNATLPSAAQAPVSQWTVATYEPVSLFSLRMTHATNKGGKTLVTPTPYAVKMALLDACFRRWQGADAESGARRVFDWIKNRPVRFRPPEHCVIQQTFVKILDHNRDPAPGEGPFRSTIAYREFAYYSGRLEIALETTGLDPGKVAVLNDLFACINQLGKRGSFWQFTHVDQVALLPQGYTCPRAEIDDRHLQIYLTSQALDDFGQPLCNDRKGFDRISTYGPSSAKIVLDKHRILTLTAIPYQLQSAGRRSTWYRRTDLAGRGG